MYKKTFISRPNVYFSESQFYREQRVTSSEIKDNGEELVRSSLQKVLCSEISAELKRISPDDYSLKNLIKAGVPLEQVNLDGFFGPSDPLEIDLKNAPMVEKAFDDLLKHDAHIAYQKIADNLKNNVTETSGNYDKTE